MAKTARDIITASLRKLGVVASGETPSAEELQDGLTALQGMIDTWSTSELLSYNETEETLSLIAGQQEYTIGTGGNFATTRPVEILAISTIDGGVESPLAKASAQDWRELSIKSLSSQPTAFHYRNTFPLGRVLVWPVPTGAISVKVYSRKPIVSVTTVNDDIDLPNGYLDAIIYNLCIELVDEFGGELSPNIMAQAEKKLAAIKNQNLAGNIPFLATESALQGHDYLILKGG
jgi:hypothetical protein